MTNHQFLKEPEGGNLTKSLVLARHADQDERVQVANPFTANGSDGISSLSRYAAILKRTWKAIALFSLSCAGLTVLVCSFLPPVFESTATVSIDVSAAPGFIGQESQRPLSVTDGDQILSTQVNLIQSDAVLRPVDARMHFTPAELGFPGSYQKNGRDIRESPLQLKALTIKRMPSTYLIKVSYRSSDPKRAAEVANAVAESYITLAFNERVQSSSNLSSFMDKQLAEIKAKMTASSAALARYERDLDIINPEQKTNIISARLLQLNQSYTEAQTQRISKEAAYNAARGGTLAASETNPQSEQLRALVEKRNSLQADFTVVAQTYGKKHPTYRTAKAELDQVEEQIKTAQTNITDRARIEFQQAAANEQTLSAAVAQSKKEFDRINSQSFAYQQLRRDAENDRRLYDDVERRIHEASLNSAFQNNSLRLADAARPSILPVFPKLAMMGTAGLVASALLGYVVAILFHSLTRKVHGVGEIAKGLGVAVIGTLPRVRGVRSKSSNSTLSDGVVNISAPLVPLLSGESSVTASSFNESIRSVRNAILASDLTDGPSSILVTSALASEGKSTVALALSISHSSRHNRILLIDGDIRRPSLSPNNDGEQGLAEVLVDNLPWRPLLRTMPGTPSLDFLAAGTNARRACDHLHQIERLIAEAKTEYDLIVIDSSPILCFADSAQLASLVNGVVLVSRAPDTQLSTLELALDNLYIAGAKLIGVVMNEVSDLNLRVGYTKYSRKYAQAATA